MSHAHPTRYREPPGQRRRAAERELIEEIAAVARRSSAARDLHGEPVFPTDGVSRVLMTVSSSRYCLAIADLARALGVRKQVAHDLAHTAERVGVIELAATTHVVRIIRQRLERDARELAARRKAQR